MNEMNVGLDSWLSAKLLSVSSRWSPICLVTELDVE